MTSTLTESDSKQLLASYGLPIVYERIAADASTAAQCGDAFGYPCVVKVCGEQVAHKTERNLVRLALGSATELLGQANRSGSALYARGRNLNR